MEKKENKRKRDKHDEIGEFRTKRKPRRVRSRSRSFGEVRESKSVHEKDSRRKRKHSKSVSPNASFKDEKRRDESSKGTENKKPQPERKAKDTDMLNTRTGGAYIPPARLRMMQSQITDKSSMAYQRLAWEALKKSIHGHINKINVGNIGIIIKELLKENIVRGRGLLCRSVIQAQAASPTFTNVYAALVAAVNSRFPNIGELLLKRLVIQFKRGFKRNDKAICISSASFIAHLVNQRVAHEILALELLTLLVETPTDDSVEVAIAFLKECGQKLTEVSSKGVNAIFEMLRNILHEGQLDKRVQYMIEVMFQVWKDGFKDHPALIEELELVPEEEQFTHLLMLDDATDPQDILNVFKFDEKYEENEQKYKTLSKDILGSDAESEEGDGSGESGSDESDDEEEEEKKEMTIIDNTETNLVALRRTIYLTINSSLDFEECAHKLMKMQLKPGQEVELCHMFLDCCAEQRTYEKFYGLLAQRFCNINRIYIGPFEEIFKDSYSTAHRLDTNRLRNVSKFFAHLLFTDSISWEVMECVRLNEEDTTSSSRIYIKILFQELAEYMGLKKLNERLKDPTLQEAFNGLFPRDNPKNTRFSINFFTSIGLGGLTDELREHLKQMPKNVPAPITEIKLDSSSSSSSSSSDDSSSSDSSSSESSGEENNTKKTDKNKNSKKKKTFQPATAEDETNDKNKESPERWGHDGFYHTYGQGARRMNPRSEKETFVKPSSGSRRGENREELRNGGNLTRDGQRDIRRESSRKDDNRGNRDQIFDDQKKGHGENRKRDGDYENHRSRQHENSEFPNSNLDNRGGRRNDNREGTSRSEREQMYSRDKQNEEDRRYRLNDNDKKRQRDGDDNNRDKRRPRDGEESERDMRRQKDREESERDKRRLRDGEDVDRDKRRERDAGEGADRDGRKQKDGEYADRNRRKQRDSEGIDKDKKRQKEREDSDRDKSRHGDGEDPDRDKRRRRSEEDADKIRRTQKDGVDPHRDKSSLKSGEDAEKDKRKEKEDTDKKDDSKKHKQNNKEKDSVDSYKKNYDTNRSKTGGKGEGKREERNKNVDTNNYKRSNKEKENLAEDNLNKSTRHKKIQNKVKKNKVVTSSSSSDTSSSSGSTSDSSSTSSSSSEPRKTKSKKKKTSNLNKKQDTTRQKEKNKKKVTGKGSSESNSDGENDDKRNRSDRNKLGGRYWDVFDIATVAGGTPEKA